MKKDLPFVQVLTVIVVSLFCVTGGVTYFVKKAKQKRQVNRSHFIESIVQTSPQKEALKTTYLAELMGLAIDRPQSAQTFNVIKAKEALLKSHVIKEAHVHLLFPHTLYVDYTVRQPVALLDNYENIAFDEEGALFPFHPFFPPKKLPLVYFRESFPISKKELDLALLLLKLLHDTLPVVRMDLSRIGATSYGRREIVLLTEDEVIRGEHQYTFPTLLRLTTKNYATELGHYLKLREQLLEEESRSLIPELPSCRFPVRIVDLRVPNLAFIKAK